MNKMIPTKMETVRALREIIATIIETNLMETYYFELIHHLIEITENQIIIVMTVDVYQEASIVKDSIQLQKNIYTDIYQMTGFKVEMIDIKIKKLILKTNKKTH